MSVRNQAHLWQYHAMLSAAEQLFSMLLSLPEEESIEALAMPPEP
jgi:hypothetical protein